MALYHSYVIKSEERSSPALPLKGLQIFFVTLHFIHLYFPET